MAAQPGHTKDLQSVQLERGIKIVDSPGVVFDEDESSDSSQKGSILLRNVVKVEDIEDPIAVGAFLGTNSVSDEWMANFTISVEEILARTEHETLQKLYNLPQFSSTLEFLTMLALNSGRLLKVSFIFVNSNTSHNYYIYREVLLTYFQPHVTFSWTGITKKSPTSPSRPPFIPRRCPLLQQAQKQSGRHKSLTHSPNRLSSQVCSAQQTPARSVKMHQCRR